MLKCYLMRRHIIAITVHVAIPVVDGVSVNLHIGVGADVVHGESRAEPGIYQAYPDVHVANPVYVCETFGGLVGD